MATKRAMACYGTGAGDVGRFMVAQLIGGGERFVNSYKQNSPAEWSPITVWWCCDETTKTCDAME